MDKRKKQDKGLQTGFNLVIFKVNWKFTSNNKCKLTLHLKINMCLLLISLQNVGEQKFWWRLYLFTTGQLEAGQPGINKLRKGHISAFCAMQTWALRDWPLTPLHISLIGNFPHFSSITMLCFAVFCFTQCQIMF